MSDAMSIALSGTRAASLQLDVAASNVANMGSTGSLPGATVSKAAYAPQRVDQSALQGPSGSAGVEARVRPIMPAYVPSFEPDAGYADKSGMVAAPNVDPLEEMVSVEEASIAFRMNLAVYKAAADMVRSLYEDTTPSHGQR